MHDSEFMHSLKKKKWLNHEVNFVSNDKESEKITKQRSDNKYSESNVFIKLIFKSGFWKIFCEFSFFDKKSNKIKIK